MAFWLVRAGKHGEQEPVILENDIVAIGWNELDDLSKVQDMESLKKLYVECPDLRDGNVGKATGQIWSFLKKIEIGDLVAVPLKTQWPCIKFGEITGDYEFKKYSHNVRHTRSVKWLGEAQHSEIYDDISNSLNAAMTVAQVRAEDAEKRMLKFLKDPTPKPKLPSPDVPGPTNLEESTRVQIARIIRANFLNHNLERLIDEILRARGYITRVSPPGSDRGVDIFAGSGQLGFDEPKICVQVKSQKDPVDVKVLRELIGVSKKFKATHSILVALGGLTKDANIEIKEQFFSIKLWDQRIIIDEILKKVIIKVCPQAKI